MEYLKSKHKDEHSLAEKERLKKQKKSEKFKNQEEKS